MSIFGRLFEGSKDKALRRQVDKELQGRAKAELQQASERLPAAFDRNNDYFFEQPNAGKLATDLILASPSPLDISGLFLFGIAIELVSSSPELPTAPLDRAHLHVMAFYARDGSGDLTEAKERASRIRDQYDAADPMADYVVSQGRAALLDDEPTYLLHCYETAHRRYMMSFLD